MSYVETIIAFIRHRSWCNNKLIVIAILLSFHKFIFIFSGFICGDDWSSPLGELIHSEETSGCDAIRIEIAFVWFDFLYGRSVSPR